MNKLYNVNKSNPSSSKILSTKMEGLRPVTSCPTITDDTIYSPQETMGLLLKIGSKNIMCQIVATSFEIHNHHPFI